ncbi:MAG: TSCPD domain-containing protein, partial [Dehalococcoidia bacterium]|nr:TSCPD domain-containing protein [Dehalococcoidia bacterium]
RKTRRIGMGVMGFSDLLIQLGARYDSEEALQVADDVMGRIQEEAHLASSELAQARGVFPAWEGSVYSQPGPSGEGRPMRNSAPTTIAPTGTISIIAGASSGIEPLFALSYVRTVMDNTRMVEANPYFEAVAKYEGFYSRELMEQLAESGSLETLDVPQWIKDVFRTSHDISPEWHVRMQGAVQRHTDNAVSKTINFPHDATVADLANAYMQAYQEGCKGITVYRDGSKAGQVLSTGGTGLEASPFDGMLGEGAELADYPGPRERPSRIRGVTERLRTGHGNMYVTINYDDDGNPFEVFGNLGKSGGCDGAQLEAITRLASLALRSGIDPGTVVGQLRGITCCPAWDSGTLVRSSPDAVALALERNPFGATGAPALPAQGGVQMHLVSRSKTNGNGNGHGHQPARKCPDCNTPVIYQEGCLMCVSCGWNKCE